MGTKVHPKAPDSEFTDYCWVDGRPFAPGPTPEFITVRFSGILKSSGWSPSDGEPPNGDYVMDRTSSTGFERFPSLPVGFIIRTNGIYQISFWNDELATVEVFSGLDSGCQKVYQNLFDGVGEPFKGGTMTILGV